LARAGTETVVIERSGDPRDAGAALALAPNGLACLDALGAGPDVRARGSLLARMALRDGRGRVLAGVEPAALDPGYDHVLVVPRSALLEVLYDAAAAEPSIELRLGREVTAEVLAGVDTDLVVGADGIGSVVRGVLSIDASVRPLRTTYVRSLLPVPVGDDLVGEWWTPIGLIGVLPCGTDTYLYASADAEPVRNALAAGDVDGFRGAWSSSVPRLAGVVAELRTLDQLLVNDVAEVHCSRFVAGRRALVGDAAHAMAPNLGQGANSALVDGAVLSASLAEAQTVEQALTAYDARRRPKVRRVQTNARRLLRMSAPHGAAVRTVRDLLLRATRRTMTSRSVALATMQELPSWLSTVRPGRPG
jgi:2-polyprenyl-6-methoxyphenol hydroxylase-like FAD-dependent oxidoreductase